jgi:hypothetical protein
MNMPLRKKTRSVPLPASATAGASVDVSDLTSMYVQVGGTFDATWQVQESFDGTNFVDVGTLSADTGGAVAIHDAAVKVRVNCPSDFTSNTSGTAAVTGLKPDEPLY